MSDQSLAARVEYLERILYGARYTVDCGFGADAAFREIAEAMRWPGYDKSDRRLRQMPQRFSVEEYREAVDISRQASGVVPSGKAERAIAFREILRNELADMWEQRAEEEGEEPK